MKDVPVAKLWLWTIYKTLSWNGHCTAAIRDVWSTSFIITASAMENKINTMNSTLPIRLRVQNHSRYFQTILELQRGCNNQQYKCQSSYYNPKIASAVWVSPCLSTYILFGQNFSPCSSSAVPLHKIEINKACDPLDAVERMPRNWRYRPNVLSDSDRNGSVDNVPNVSSVAWIYREARHCRPFFLWLIITDLCPRLQFVKVKEVCLSSRVG